MNAHVEVAVLQENFAASAACVDALNHVNESLQRREGLLAASAKASHLLLEAPDVRGAVPTVLRLIGEAAGVDRVQLRLSQAGPAGEPLLVVSSEWAAEGVALYTEDPSSVRCDERAYPAVSAELRAGRSVYLSRSEMDTDYALVALEGIGTKTKALVPIFVAGEFSGAVGFDNTKQRRSIDSAELASLETAAGVIGAAL
ncbi:MAG TPA: GAF domain-containing protein, partial [Steroidobacteraceae bacterium]